MEFQSCTVIGAFVIVPQPRGDDRGWFARMWCAQELAQHGLVDRVAQVNVAHSQRAGTLRGMHYQQAPHGEVKIVRCNRGAVFDVVVDLRPPSPSYKRWFGTELSETNGRMLYVPQGCAHGYQTLSGDAEVMYFTSAFYAPAAANGVRYDDPAFGIYWPRAVTALSEQDRNWPDYKD